MTEFNAQEIINHLNQKLFNDIRKVVNRENAAYLYDHVARTLINSYTENVRKVERYAVEVEGLNKSTVCRFHHKGYCSRAKMSCYVVRSSETPRYGRILTACSNWQPRYTLEDFK